MLTPYLSLQTLGATDEVFPAQISKIHIAGGDSFTEAHTIPQPKQELGKGTLLRDNIGARGPTTNTCTLNLY